MRSTVRSCSRPAKMRSRRCPTKRSTWRPAELTREIAAAIPGSGQQMGPTRPTWDGGFGFSWRVESGMVAARR